MRFHQILKSLEKDSQWSRKSIIARLQLLYEEFSCLDDITFSRWVNGVTTPSIHKQILLTSFFKLSLDDYLGLIDNPRVPKKIDALVNKAFSELDGGYHRVKYFSLIPESTDAGWFDFNSKVNIQQLTTFYKQISYYEKITNTSHELLVDKLGDVITIQENGVVISHISFYIKPIEYNVRDFTNIDLACEDVVVNVGYYSCKKNFYILFGCMLVHVLKNKSCVNNLYVIFRGRFFMNFVNELGGEVMQQRKEKNGYCPVYVAKFDWFKFISSPFMFILMKGSAKWMEDIYSEKRVDVNLFEF